METPPFSFLTNHAQVLLDLRAQPDARMRDVAARLCITERAVQRIVAELSQAGYLVREKQGRRNRYQVREVPAPVRAVAALPDGSPRLGVRPLPRQDSFID